MQPDHRGWVLYGTSPELVLFALDAATGKELWRFNPSLAAAIIRRSASIVAWCIGRMATTAGFYIPPAPTLCRQCRQWQNHFSFGDAGRVNLKTV